MVIGFAVEDGTSAIDLFQQKNSHHLVGKGHERQRYSRIGAGTEALGETVGPADGECKFGDTTISAAADERGKLGRRHLRTPLIQENEPGILRQMFREPLTFLFPQGLFSAALFFTNLGYIQGEVAPDATGVLLDSRTHPLLLRLPDPQDPQSHPCLSSQRYSAGISISGASDQSSSRL